MSGKLIELMRSDIEKAMRDADLHGLAIDITEREFPKSGLKKCDCLQIKEDAPFCRSCRVWSRVYNDVLNQLEDAIERRRE